MWEERIGKINMSKNKKCKEEEQARHYGMKMNC